MQSVQIMIAAKAYRVLGRKASASAIYRKYSIATASSVELPNEWESAKPFDAIPGPKPLPIIGNVWRFLGGIDFVKLGKQMHKYGDVVRMSKFLAFGDMIFIFNVRDIEWMFRHEGPWPIRDTLASGMIYRHQLRKDIFGDTYGLINGQNEDWGSFRTAVNPIMMQPRVTHQYIPQINNIADEFIANIEKLRMQNPNGEMPKTFADELNKWAFESITAIALDTRLGCLDENPSEKAQKAIDHITELFRIMLKLDMMPTGKYHRQFNTPTWKRYIAGFDYFTDMVLDLIEKAQERIKNDPNYHKKLENEKSVFEKLVAKDKKIAMVMILDMMAAGIDTTAKIAGATLYFLSKSPDAQTKLRAELKRFLPSKDTPITKEMLEDAKYLRASIKEALRIAPIGFGNLRRSTKPMVLGGYQIPVNTILTVPNLYLSTGIDTHFTNPQEYIPDRWVRATKTDSVNPFVTLPFGFGARSCIGKRMANMEIEILIAKVVRHYNLDWKYPDMTFRHDLLYGINDPLRLRLASV